MQQTLRESGKTLRDRHARATPRGWHSRCDGASAAVRNILRALAPFALALVSTLVACGGGDDGDPSGSKAPAPGEGAKPAATDAERQEVDAMLEKTTGKAGPDRDGDGIDDVDEEILLRHYRPFLKFSKDGDGKDESHRPSDPLAVIRGAQLVQQKGDGDGITDPLPGCGKAPDYRLDPVEQLYSCKKDTSFIAKFAKTTYALSIPDSQFAGVSFTDYKKDADGFFGHVVPDTVSGHPAYKLEYWQYYAYNNQDLGLPGFHEFGDHQGDWTGIQLWVDKGTTELVQVLYMIHGRKAWFHYKPEMLKATCKDCFVTIKGPKYNANPGNFFDDDHRAEYDDNQSELRFDADGNVHVVVYVENGGHESWPFPYGHADIDVKIDTWHPNPHKGDGTNMISPVPTTRPLNAGEVTKPFTADYATILQYNGYWGGTNTNDLGVRVRKSPPGPASHCEWKFPDRGSIASCEN